MTTPTRVEVTIPVTGTVNARDFDGEPAMASRVLYTVRPGFLNAYAQTATGRTAQMFIAPFDALPGWAPQPPDWFWDLAEQIVPGLAFKDDDNCSCGQPATTLGQCEPCRKAVYAARPDHGGNAA